MARRDMGCVKKLLEIINEREIPDRKAIHDVFHEEGGYAPQAPIPYALEYKINDHLEWMAKEKLITSATENIELKLEGLRLIQAPEA